MGEGELGPEEAARIEGGAKVYEDGEEDGRATRGRGSELGSLRDENEKEGSWRVRGKRRR